MLQALGRAEERTADERTAPGGFAIRDPEVRASVNFFAKLKTLFEFCASSEGRMLKYQHR
jgi:hypothetical protein